MSEEDVPHTKVEARDSTTPQSVAYIAIKKHGIANKQQWINTKALKKGSPISVDIADVNNYWVWERCWEQGVPVWRFRLNLEEDLYISHGESDNVTMQPSGPNSYFYVNASEKGGFVFHVPNEQRYIAESEGHLVLSNTPTLWSMITNVEANRPGAVQRDILVIKEELTGKKWICDSPAPNASVVVDFDYGEEKKTQWLSQFIIIDEAWHFQARKNENLFITCTVSDSQISLEIGTNENRKERLVKGKGEDSVIMQDYSGTKYFCSQIEGTTSLLALTDQERLATTWQFLLCGFDVDGQIIPPDSYSGCEKMKSEESTIEDQAIQPQQAQAGK